MTRTSNAHSPPEEGTARSWMVTVRLRGTVPSLDELDEALGAVAGTAPAARLDPDGVAVRVTVEADTVEQALRLGVERTRAALVDTALGEAAVVGGAVAEERLDPRAVADDTPSVVGVDEVAELLELSSTQVRDLLDSPRFPEPLARLAQGPVWLRAHVERYRERLEARSR